MIPRIAVLASGQGTLLAAIYQSGIPITLVATDRPCQAWYRAKVLRIKMEIVERTDFTKKFNAQREEFTLRLLHLLRAYDIGVVVMAGFMTVLSPIFFERYKGRVLNCHPALLPDFKGAHAVRDTLAAGIRWTGSTVHLAEAEVDSGRILAQSRVRILPHSTVATLHERLKKEEHVLYPQAIKEYLRELEAK